MAKAVRKCAVFDIDGTLIRWQLYHSLADTLAKLGFIDDEYYLAMKEARMAWKRRTGGKSYELYERSVIRAFDSAVKGLGVDKFDEAATLVFKEYKDQVYTYPRDTIKRLKEKGYLLLAVSGSPEIIVEKVARYHKFDDFVGTTYGSKGGSLTGSKKVASYRKEQLLQQMLTEHRVGLRGSVGIGDTASDIPLLDMVETPIAFNPEEKLFAHASANGWKVVIERKNMVFELEAKSGRYQLAKTNG